MRRTKAPIDIAPDFTGRFLFEMNDIVRRTQAHALTALGLGPHECPYQVVASGPYWRLRDYGDRGKPRVLIVAAPIKRPYIWDLGPSFSAIDYCLRQGLHIYLLEWLPASPQRANNGVDEYADAIADCVAAISALGEKPALIGHSLGGTLAAVFAASASATIRSLALLSAPLCFAPAVSGFRDALVALVPSGLSEDEPFPGSLLSHMSAMASPRTFIWSRWTDALLSLGDPQAMEMHGRIERWALDEVPLPGKLVHQIIEWLYRENRFCRGSLRLHQTLVGPSGLSAPTLTVVNAADEVAPLASVQPFIDAASTTDVKLVEFPGEAGACLQHLAILIGRHARARTWPQIISWIRSH